MKKQYRDFLFYYLFVSFFAVFMQICWSFCVFVVLWTLWKYTFVTVVILFSHYSKKRLLMHACTRSAKQKYGSIYIFLDENVFENGCIYILDTCGNQLVYIYIYIYIYIFNSYSSRTRRIWTDIYNQRGRRPSWLLSAHIRQVREE